MLGGPGDHGAGLVLSFTWRSDGEVREASGGWV